MAAVWEVDMMALMERGNVTTAELLDLLRDAAIEPYFWGDVAREWAASGFMEYSTSGAMSP